MNLIAKEYLIDPELFDKLGPHERLFLDLMKSLMKLLKFVYYCITKMGIFNNVGYNDEDISEYMKYLYSQTQQGLKLDSKIIIILNKNVKGI